MTQKVRCELCPRHCNLADGAIGVCKGRWNQDGLIRPLNYGCITSFALDPIEKKPLYHFFPGSYILSVGSFGCNFKCPFCQNHSISMAGNSCDYRNLTPEDLISLAIQLKNSERGNIGIAFTYNEPLISYEFVLDTSKELKKYNLKSVLVTNGGICSDYLENLLPYIDAMNIDLKGFTDHYYEDILLGNRKMVMEFIKEAVKHCHVELTTLVIPNENDSDEEMDELSSWIASLDKNIPLHISRFFPRFHMTDKEATPVDTIYHLKSIAEKHLTYVYTGNC